MVVKLLLKYPTKKGAKRVRTVRANAKAVNDSIIKVMNALHAMRIRTENLRMLLPKVQNPARRKSQAVQNEDIRRPADRKRKMTGKHSSKIQSLTLVKRDGHVENRRNHSSCILCHNDGILYKCRHYGNSVLLFICLQIIS